MYTTPPHLYPAAPPATQTKFPYSMLHKSTPARPFLFRYQDIVLS
ncbi:hypothetical protein EYZ11_011580 [Aspergillus tanneri]|uniref:Uncharacterized protein n=1 Tax=Aspergillus tanneri TaxID=1220188 RepID=A0A4S3J2R5_9EURO|nr:hypothetical protein EYZ11_011580 [Aspergillus tanneri]